MSTVSFRLTAGTHVGCVRTNNEDNFIINEDLSQSDWFIPQDTSQVLNLGPEGAILVVTDGMGGLNAGEVASAIAVDTLKQIFLDSNLKKVAKSAKSIEKFMRDIVGKADTSIKNHVKEHPETQGMGTTLIFAWIHGETVHLMWCGDSRAYIYNNIDANLIRLSKDHSYVQQLVDEGKLNPELAFDHPNSNIITRCLGDFQDKAKPDYRSYSLKKGDVILLCSDGLCGLCRDEEIKQILDQTYSDIEQCKLQLIQGALNAGGYDNVTVALFETVDITKSEEILPIFSINKLKKEAKKTLDVNDLETIEEQSKEILANEKIVDESQSDVLNEEIGKVMANECEPTSIPSDDGENSNESDTNELEDNQEVAIKTPVKSKFQIVLKNVCVILLILTLFLITFFMLSYHYGFKPMELLEIVIQKIDTLKIP